MSFRLFVYYCALIGGWTGFLGAVLGWFLAGPVAGQSEIGGPGVRGMFLGLSLAMGLGLVDALWAVSWNRIGHILLRMLVAVTIGAVGGLAGGVVGQLLFAATGLEPILVVGWTITGVLCGASIGSFELAASIIRGKEKKGAAGKLIKCLLGGAVGGFLGGSLAWLWMHLVPSLTNRLSQNAIGFVAVGACVGLLVGLAQVILKEAWIRVEEGFRAGREMILSKEKTTVGRGEGNDLGLYGDNGVEKQHAQIVLVNGRYVVEDSQTPGGTFVNDKRVNGRTPLQSGDVIRMGKSVLRFYEKQKRR